MKWLENHIFMLKGSDWINGLHTMKLLNSFTFFIMIILHFTFTKNDETCVVSNLESKDLKTFCWHLKATQALHLLCPASTHLLSGSFCSTAYWEAESAEVKYSQMCVSTKTWQIRRGVTDCKSNLTALIGRGLTVCACVCVCVHYMCCKYMDMNNVSVRLD